MSIQNCPECGVMSQMTCDHIIPIWLRPRLPLLGVNHKDICNDIGLSNASLERQVCTHCNLAKGGTIVYGDKLVRKYMSAVLVAIYNRIKAAEASTRRLNVRCDCLSALGAAAVVLDKIPSMPLLKVAGPSPLASGAERWLSTREAYADRR